MKKTNDQTHPPLYTGSTTEKRLPSPLPRLFIYPASSLLVSVRLHSCIYVSASVYPYGYEDADT